MSLSYTVTGFAPDNINKKFLEAKKYFGSLIQNPDKNGIVITQNTAHVTLKRKFYLKTGVEEDTVIEALGGVTFEPISVSTNRLMVFYSEKLGNILMALVSQSRELINIHNQLSQAIDGYIEFEAKEFVPHLSILYNLPKEKIKEAKEYVAKKIMPIEFTLDTLSLLRDTGTVKERTLVKMYLLGEDN